MRHNISDIWYHIIQVEGTATAFYVRHESMAKQGVYWVQQGGPSHALLHTSHMSTIVSTPLWPAAIILLPAEPYGDIFEPFLRRPYQGSPALGFTI